MDEKEKKDQESREPGNSKFEQFFGGDRYDHK